MFALTSVSVCPSVAAEGAGRACYWRLPGGYGAGWVNQGLPGGNR
jgi:hypothetical protein